MPYIHPEKWFFYDAHVDSKYILSLHPIGMGLLKMPRTHFANKIDGMQRPAF